ncbi:MAG: DUF420 domain-containing protein [Planctomycetaceae bacterium]
MAHGFLGHQASFMLDVIVCALILIVPTIGISLYQVKVRRNYALHRRLQIALGLVLFCAVTAFEIDMRFVQHGWKNLVARRQPPLEPSALAFVSRLLSVHLVFAVSTCVLWSATLLVALRQFSTPPLPGPHSRLHKTLGWLSTLDMTLTSLTGLAFYYLAFMAR